MDMSIRSTNPQLKETAADLKRQSRKNKVRIWETVAEELCKSKRSRVAVNVGQINRVAADAKAVAVAGTVLGGGEATGSLTVGAFKFTEQARIKLEKAGGKCLSLTELAEKYPKGTGVKIVK